jgi:hypothetical protein
MDGVTLLRRAREAGLAVAVEGYKLVIRGPRRAEPVARLLIEHKPEVMAALAPSVVDCLDASELACATAGDRGDRHVEGADNSASVTNARRWRNFYAERAAHYELGGGRLRAEAEALTWAEAQLRWYSQHGERVPQDICAGCRRPIGTASALDLIDGNRVHLDSNTDCLIRHGARWRARATRSLMELGLRPPVGVAENG